jgi:cytochrome P450
MFEMVTDRLNYCSELMEDYGDIVKVPAFKKSYMINDAEMIKYVLKENPENYLKQGLGFKSVQRCLGNGLIMQQGEEWRQRRKHYAPVFQPKHIAHYSNTIQKFTQKHLNKMRELYADSNESFDISSVVMSIVYEIALDVFCQQSIDEQSLLKILDAINFEHRYSTSLHNLVPWLPTFNYWRYKKARSVLQTHIETLINTAKNQSDSQDLLHKILTASHADGSPLSEQNIFDEVKTFLMTGHETSGTAIAWSMKVLAEHPEVQKKMKQELAKVLQGRAPCYEDIAKLPYTKAVFDETLRLYPPIWMTSRICQEDDYIGDYFIAKGTTIIISPYTVHRRECYWEKPDEFIPERHLAHTENKPPMFAFIPFLGGPRVCIAHHFAAMECVLIIAMVMQQFELNLDEDYPVESEHIISLKPRNGIYVKLKYD